MTNYLSLIWIPCLLFLIVYRPKHLIGSLFFASVFQAQSIIEFESGFTVPITPTNLFQLLITATVILVIISRRTISVPVDIDSKRILVALFAFSVYALASAFVFPFIFSGLPVYSPRGGIDDQNGYLTPLTFTGSNLAQAAYLVFSFLIVLKGRAIHSDRTFHIASKWYFWSGLAICLFCVWQKLNQLLDIYYPYDFIHSNTVIHSAEEVGYIIADKTRVSGPFSEPSLAGLHLVCYLTFVSRLLLYRVPLIERSLVLISLVLSAFSLLITGSTTAYIGLLCLALLTAAEFSPISKGVLHISRLRTWAILSAVLILSAIISFVFFSTELEALLVSAIIDKGDSISAINRLASDARALEIFNETSWLGAGLGSNRPSSFITFLLSNVGIIGTFLFGYSLYRLFRSGSAPQTDDDRLRKALITSLVVMVIAKLSSVPDLNTPWMWLLISLTWTTASPVKPGTPRNRSETLMA